MWRILVTICALNVPACASEAAAGRTEWKIPSTESFIVRSSADQREFEIMIGLPRHYAKSEAKHPVLYVLDANGMFPIAVETVRFLMFEPLKEEPIIVGIGYPVGLYWNTLADRFRDFTPTADPQFMVDISRRFDFSSQGTGGAGAFLRFLADELMPAVESRYRIDSRRRALHGYSLGGLFATYVLFNQPELFQSYLIGAPSLWWDRDVGWRLERSFADNHRKQNAQVYLTVGSLDQKHVPLVTQLDRLLHTRNYSGLLWRTEYFENETHDSAIPLTLSRGIRWLYGDLAPTK